MAQRKDEIYTMQQLLVRNAAEQLLEALEHVQGDEQLAGLRDRLRGLIQRAHTLPTGDWKPLVKPLLIPEHRVIRTDGVE